MEPPVSSPPDPGPEPAPSSQNRWRERGVLLFGLLIIGAFFLPWVGNYDLMGMPTPNPRRVVPFRLALSSTEWVWLWLVPGSAAVLVVSSLLRQPVKVLGFVTSGITLLVSLGLLLGLQSVSTRFGPGGFIGVFAALGLLALLGEPPELKAEPEFVRLTSKPKGLIQHWFVYLEDFHTSAKEFYDQVEEEVKRRQLPKLELRRMLFFEGGLISARREYLRLRRERVLFDICAAPFGTSFFFSYRVCEVPNHIGFLELLAVFYGGLMLLSLLFQAFGFFGGLVAAVVLLGVLVLLIWKSPRVQAGSLDDFLLNLRIIGPIYWLFRRRTYHRLDTHLMYLRAIETIVKRQAGEVTAAHGVKLGKQFETSQMFAGAYEERPKEIALDLASPIPITTDAQGA